MKTLAPSLIVLIVILAAGGCGAASLRTGDNPARYQVEFDRLKRDLPRAVERCNWGLLHQKTREDGVVECEALLPGEQVAHIEASRIDDAQAMVSIRVGIDGDPVAERMFHDTLAQSLADRPRRIKGGKFKLPAWF